MKIAQFVVLLLLLGLAGLAGWYLGAKRANSDSAEPGRKVLYYQSAMHPWIKSDKPGNCTICGMKLTPVYEGEKGFDIEPDVVVLSELQHQVLHVQTEPVVERPLEKNLPVAGRIEADETKVRLLSAYIDGRIEELFVNFVGAEVQKGEPLATFYSPALLTAEQELATLLAQSPRTNSPRLEAEHARLVEATRQRLRRFGLTAEQINQIGEKAATNLTTQIVAPISGTVITRAVYEGQYVKEGDKLFEIADLASLWFRFDVYEQDLPWIHIGQAVKVTIPAVPGRTFEGSITFVEPTLNEATRSAKVRVELDNPLVDGSEGPRRLLLNNLYAEGAILIATEPVLAVPRRAVLNPGDRARVYVANEGAYEQRPIRLGRRGNQFWEVLEGLEPGEKVVTSGNLMIDSQAEINRGIHSSPHEHSPVTAEENLPEGVPHELTDSQKAALDFFFQGVSRLSAALAADDLKQYTEALDPFLAEALPKLQAELNDSPFRPVIEKISQSAQLKGADSLDSARTRYLPFSNATAAFLQELRKHAPLQHRVFRCPMYPKVGQSAYWVQAGPVTRNPFYGDEMLECGVELR